MNCHRFVGVLDKKSCNKNRCKAIPLSIPSQIWFVYACKCIRTFSDTQTGQQRLLDHDLTNQVPAIRGIDNWVSKESGVSLRGFTDSVTRSDNDAIVTNELMDLLVWWRNIKSIYIYTHTINDCQPLLLHNKHLLESRYRKGMDRDKNFLSHFPMVAKRGSQCQQVIAAGRCFT